MEVSVISVDSTSIPTGTVIPPSGTTSDHLPPTDICCENLWAVNIPVCLTWDPHAIQSISWTCNDC